jgi:hypothetical protein
MFKSLMLLCFISLSAFAVPVTEPLFTVMGKTISIDAKGNGYCTAGCVDEESSIGLTGDKLNDTFAVWYIANMTVIGQVDGGVKCPSGSWYAIDLGALTVTKLKLPDCSPIVNRLVIATDRYVKFSIMQTNHRTSFKF